MKADEINAIVVTTTDLAELRAIKDMFPKWKAEVERKINLLEEEILYANDHDEPFWQK